MASMSPRRGFPWYGRSSETGTAIEASVSGIRMCSYSLGMLDGRTKMPSAACWAGHRIGWTTACS